MIKKYLSGYVVVVVLLALAWMSLGGRVSQASPSAPLAFTDTPTPTSTATATTTATATATATTTVTATPTEPEDTPIPPDTPVPGPEITPTSTPGTPVGTVTLPFTGQVDLIPVWLLLVAAGALLSFGVLLGWQSRRSL